VRCSMSAPDLELVVLGWTVYSSQHASQEAKLRPGALHIERLRSSNNGVALPHQSFCWGVPVVEIAFDQTAIQQSQPAVVLHSDSGVCCVERTRCVAPPTETEEHQSGSPDHTSAECAVGWNRILALDEAGGCWQGDGQAW
jgi:hypothetical protein